MRQFLADEGIDTEFEICELTQDQKNFRVSLVTLRKCRSIA